MTKSLEDIFGENEIDKAKRLADLARYDSPEEVAKRKAKRDAEEKRHIELGWLNPDGSVPEAEEEIDEDEEPDED